MEVAWASIQRLEIFIDIFQYQILLMDSKICHVRFEICHTKNTHKISVKICCFTIYLYLP